MITNIRELRRAFDDAELRADADRLNALLADDFMSIGERCVQLGKRQWIARHADFAIGIAAIGYRGVDRTRSISVR